MNLSHRQNIIQETKKQNSFADFLREIVSRYPLVLYKNQGLISLYPDNDRSCPVIPHKEFIDQIPTLTSHGLEYNDDVSFWDNFGQLLKHTPFSALYNYSGAVNSEFAFSVLNSKNCYLSFTVITDCENICYSFAVKEGCTNVFYSAQISDHCSNIYMATCVIKSYNIFFSKFITDSSDLRLCTNMIGCHNCLMCDGLTNQSYCIRNQQYSKEEYTQLIQQELSQISDYDYYYTQLNSLGSNYGSTDVTGNFVLNSEHVDNGMYSFNLKDARNTLVVGSPHENRHMYDAFEAGSLGNSHFYGVINTGVNSEHVYNSEGIVTCYEVYYSRFLENCKYCLGCIGLQNQEYCILNKQYTKEEWYTKVNSIFETMNIDGVLGQYFPGSINPFNFNDTLASLVGDFDQESIVQAGYLWRDEPITVDIPEWMDTISTSTLDIFEHRDNGSLMIDPAILKKVILDDRGNNYRVIKMEYDFLIKHGIPLPRKHWLDRMKENFRINSFTLGVQI